MNSKTKSTKGLLKSEIEESNTSLTIKAFIEEFLQDRRAQNLSPTTIKFYRSRLTQFERFCHQHQVTTVESITPDTIRLFILHLEQKGHNDGGRHTYYRTIKTFLFFYESELEPTNWMNPIRKVKAPRMIVEPLEGVPVEVVHKLIDTCPRGTMMGERNRAILMVLLETGVRAAELIQMNIEDINLNESSILVRRGKGRKPRTVFVGSIARRQLRKWLKYRGVSSGALFVNNGGERLRYNGLREVIRRVSRLAGVDCPGIHDFRRTFALEMLRRGVDIQSIARLMGHTSLQVISRYLKQTDRDLGNSFKSIIDDN